MRILGGHGVIVLPVVAHDERPPPAVAVVRAAAVEEVAVEEDCVTRFELHVGVAKSFPGKFYSFQVGPNLFANLAVLDSTQLVRTRYDL